MKTKQEKRAMACIVSQFLHDFASPAHYRAGRAQAMLGPIHSLSKGPQCDSPGYTVHCRPAYWPQLPCWCFLRAHKPPRPTHPHPLPALPARPCPPHPDCTTGRTALKSASHATPRRPAIAATTTPVNRPTPAAWRLTWAQLQRITSAMPCPDAMPSRCKNRKPRACNVCARHRRAVLKGAVCFGNTLTKCLPTDLP